MKRILCTMAAIGVAGAAWAQSNAPVADFGAGFAKFYQLGLPDVSGGTYGKLEMTHYGNRPYDYSQFSGGRLGQLGLSGNAWKIKELGSGSNRYVIGVVTVADVMDQKVFDELMKRQREEMMKAAATQAVQAAVWTQPAMAAGRWKTADLKKDVAKALKMLEEKEDEGRASWLRYDTQAGGEMLLAAAQLYRIGMKDEANRIADKIFSSQQNQQGKRMLLQGAVGVIAQQEYGKCYSAFRDSQDWGAWYKDLSDLQAKFAGSWVQIPGVKKLAGLVKVRSEQADPPALVGEGLTDEDQKLARRLSVEPSQPNQYYGGGECWIFPQPHRPRRMPGMAGVTNDVVFDIRERGIAAVPMLIAMLKDSTLTARDRNQGGMHGGVYYDGRRGEEQMAEQAFNAIQRPATRGEIARGMVQPLLIMDDRQRGEVYRMSNEDMALECEAWLKEYKGKSVDDLARIYMEKGDQSQRQQAMNCLMRGKSIEENKAEIEKMLLAMVKESRDNPYIVQDYVRQRREKASNFVEQVAAIMATTNAPAETAGDPRLARVMRMRRARGGNDRETFVKQLREMVAVRSVRDLLNEIVSGTGSVVKAHAKLNEQISREAPEGSLAAILETAQKVDDPAKRVMLLGMVNTLKYAREGGWDQSDPEAWDPETGGWKPNKFDPAKHAEVWNKLLEDKRGEGKSVREAAAWSIEALYREAEPRPSSYYGQKQQAAMVLSRLGPRGQDLQIERARAILTGQTMPELPAADKVDADRRKQVIDGILSAADAGAALAKLTMDEQLALGEVAKTNKAVNTKLRPVADTVTEIKVPPELKAAEPVAAKLKGRKFDVELVRALLDACLKMAGDGSSFIAVIARQPNAAGTVVSFAKPPDPAQNQGMAMYYGMMGMPAANTNRQVTAGVTASMIGGRHYSHAWWPAKTPGKATIGAAAGGPEDKMMDEAEADIRTVGDRQKKNEQESFWQDLGEAVEKSGAFLPMSVTLVAEAGNVAGAVK